MLDVTVLPDRISNISYIPGTDYTITFAFKEMKMLIFRRSLLLGLTLFLFVSCSTFSSRDICSDSVPASFNPIFEPPENLKIEKFEDNHWITLEDLAFYFGEDPRIKIVVPAGFVTDLTSFDPIKENPKLINSSILHDYIYWVQPCQDDLGYKIANKIMKQTWKNDGAGRVLAFFGKGSVQTLGKYSWNRNKELKEYKATRFASDNIGKKYWDSIRNSTWETFREKNRLEQVESDTMITDPMICKVFPKWTDKCMN